MIPHLLLLPLVAIAGALAFRIRGGLLEDQHVLGQVSRLAWGVLCGLTVLAGAWTLTAWWIALAVLMLTWLSTTAGLHHSIDMGANLDTEDNGETRVWVRFLRDFVVGHLHGLLLGAAAALPLAVVWWGAYYTPELGAWSFPQWWLPLVGGALWGVCYAVATWLVPGWDFLRRVRIGGVPPGKGGNAPEGAELLFGAEFAVFLFFAATGG